MKIDAIKISLPQEISANGIHLSERDLKLKYDMLEERQKRGAR